MNITAHRPMVLDLKSCYITQMSFLLSTIMDWESQMDTNQVSLQRLYSRQPLRQYEKCLLIFENVFLRVKTSFPFTGMEQFFFAEIYC